MRLVNIALLKQRPETPDRTMADNLVDKVRRLVDCIQPSDRQAFDAVAFENLTIAKNALDTAKAVERHITRLQKRIAELECLADTDELTGLLNRRGFTSELQRTLANASRYEEEGVLIYIDLDGFKPVNDSYGHTAGDEVLKQVARSLKENIRDTDYVGRLGGDEFAVLMTRTTWENGLTRAEIIDHQLNSMIVNWHNRMIAIAASLGLQTYGANDEGLDLIHRADQTMYKTKRMRSYISGTVPYGSQA